MWENKQEMVTQRHLSAEGNSLSDYICLEINKWISQNLTPNATCIASQLKSKAFLSELVYIPFPKLSLETSVAL